MIYLNGEIGKIYLDGHYHGEAYFGNALVWSGVQKIPIEVHSGILLVNTAAGVVMTYATGTGNASEKLLSSATVDTQEMADAASTLEPAFDSSATADTQAIDDGVSTLAPAFYSSGKSEMVGLIIGSPLPSFSSLTLKATGTGVIVSKDDLLVRLQLTTTVPTADVAIINPFTIEHDLQLTTTVPTADVAIINPFTIEQGLQLTTNMPSAGAFELIPIALNQNISILQPPAEGTEIDLTEAVVIGFENFSGVCDGSSASLADGEAEWAISFDGVISPDIVELYPAEVALEIPCNSSTNPETFFFEAALTNHNFSLSGMAEGAMYIPWEYPVEDGEFLTITQVYNVEENGEYLEVM